MSNIQTWLSLGCAVMLAACATDPTPPNANEGGPRVVETHHGTVEAQGAQLHTATRGTGPTCLVLTAIGSEPYRQLMPPPLTEHLRLVTVDLRGSGRSTGDPTDLTFDRLADDLEAVRVALGEERVAVLGHSILGMLAVEYARRYPESVSHVILVGTPPSGDLGALAAASTAFFEEHASEDRKQVLRDNLASLPEGASMGQAMHAQAPMRFYDARFDSAPLYADADADLSLLMHLMGSLAPGWTLRSDAEALTVPIFIALGRHDYAVPHVLLDGVADELPNATRYVFEKSGHQPFFEQPAAFAEAVSAWMAQSSHAGS